MAPKKEVHEIEPLRDPRWSVFLEQNPQASLFHSPGWLAALQETYGFQVRAVTSADAHEDLTDALVFCRVRSWATGSRLVSLPFSDHCAPLVRSEHEFEPLWSYLKREWEEGRERYIEIRSPASRRGEEAGPGRFFLHRLDLSSSPSQLFKGFHNSCIRRKISRAEKQGVTYEQGTSQELLQKFYVLNVLTRRRHRVPPQPLTWFHNLIACIGSDLEIRVASFKGHPAAAILTIRYKKTMTYKYGCSDPQFHRLGAMQLLMWRAIQDAKDHALHQLDLGRTDWNNEGLVKYKDNWGSSRSVIEYLRYPAQGIESPGGKFPESLAKAFYTWTPSKLLIATGSLLYRHIG